MKRIFCCFLTLTVLIGWLLPVSAAAPTNELLRIGVNQEFENLNPLILQMAVTTYSYQMVGRTLMKLDKNAKWAASLAKSLPSFENGEAKFITENGKKKIQAVWEIREGVKWGDGKPVTGFDVEFSWKVGKSDNVAVGEKEVYSDIERIDVDPKNPNKFTFTYGKPKWDFYQRPSFYLLPKHLEEPVFKKFGDQPQGYEKNSLYNTDPTNPGLYNGPYVVEEIKLGSHISFKQNQHWNGDKPKIKRIIVKLIPNTATLEANLLSGNIDMIGNLSLPFDQALAFDGRAKKGNLPFSVNFKTGLIYEHIDLQLKNPILKDIRVRRALVYGLNRKKLVDTIYDGKLTPAIHDLSPTDPWYTDDETKIVTYKFSRKKAKELLEEAGWKLNKSDGLRYKDNKKLSLQIMTTSGNKVRELVEAFLQEEWKRIGVELVIKNEPARVFFGETVRKAKFPALAMFAWLTSPDNIPRSTLHSESIPSEKNGFSGQNDTNWVSKDVDDLIAKMDLEFDPAKRADLRHKILWHYTNEVPVIPLYYRSDISVTPKNINGYQLTGTQYGATNHVELWSLK